MHNAHPPGSGHVYKAFKIVSRVVDSFRDRLFLTQVKSAFGQGMPLRIKIPEQV